jgi:hypothetical protein
MQLQAQRTVVSELGCATSERYNVVHRYKLGPLIIRVLDILLGYASPYFMDAFTPKT